MTIIETLLANYPIRKTKAQKEAFRAWFVEEAARMGYAASVHAKGISNNVVVGDPETARVTCTAHYDTPAVMPLPNFITPKNLLAYILYQLLMVAVFVVVCAGAGAFVGFLTKSPLLGSCICMAAYFALLILLLAGPANKSCANDNTSGVAAVMEIMARLPEAERQKAAFILFDNEEKGMLGSSAYAAAHKRFKKSGLVINLDCVGDGEHIFFFANKRTRALPAYTQLEKAMGAQRGRVLHMDRMEKAVYPSDQACFKYGIAVCACNRAKGIGYYVDKIHTKKDTVCEQGNLDFLADGLADFVVQTVDTCGQL